MVDYQHWLEGFRAKASGGFRLGPHAFRRMLADDDMVVAPLSRLEDLGRNELARLQAEFKRVAALIAVIVRPRKYSGRSAATIRSHPS